MISKNENEKYSYSCSICDKLFTTSSNLSRHKKTHKIDDEQQNDKNTESDNFKCDICNKRMRDNYQLKLHTRTHTKEKPFQCNECRVSFGRSGDLKRHKTKCDGKIRNHCSNCNQVFRNKQLHNDHVLWDLNCGKLNNMKPSGSSETMELVRVKADSDMDWVGFLPKETQDENETLSNNANKSLLAFGEGGPVNHKKSRRKFGCGICEGCRKSPCGECPSCKASVNNKPGKPVVCSRNKCFHPVHYYSQTRAVKKSAKVKCNQPLVTEQPTNKTSCKESSFCESLENPVDCVDNFLSDELNLFQDFGLELAIASDVIVMNEDVVS